MTDWQELLTPTDSVLSVNGQTGAVVLNTDDINEGTTNLYYTDARVDARIAAASIDDLSDVDTSTTVPTAGQILSWDGSNWVPADDKSSVEHLADIGDITITDIADGQYVKWDAANNQWVNADLPAGVDGTFKSLTDTPNSYDGESGKFVRVNGAGDALEFSTAGIDDLSDVDTSTTAPTANDSILQWDGTNWVPVAASAVGRTTFTALDDTPADYSGTGGYTVKVKSDESGLEFVDESTIDGGTY